MITPTPVLYGRIAYARPPAGGASAPARFVHEIDPRRHPDPYWGVVRLPAEAGGKRMGGVADSATIDDALRTLQDAIRACRRCVEAGYLPSAAPILRGTQARG